MTDCYTCGLKDLVYLSTYKIDGAFFYLCPDCDIRLSTDGEFKTSADYGAYREQFCRDHPDQCNQ